MATRSGAAMSTMNKTTHLCVALSAVVTAPTVLMSAAGLSHADSPCKWEFPSSTFIILDQSNGWFINLPGPRRDDHQRIGWYASANAHGSRAGHMEGRADGVISPKDPEGLGTEVYIEVDWDGSAKGIYAGNINTSDGIASGSTWPDDHSAPAATWRSLAPFKCVATPSG